MTAFGSLGCLLVGSALPLGALYLIALRGWRQFGVADAYQQVARQLGLWADTRGISVHGQLGDRRIWIGEVLVGHGTSRRTETWGLVDLTRPLGLGLRITGRGILRRRSSFVVEDSELAKRIAVSADDPRTATQLLQAEVLGALTRLTTDWPDIEITDDDVRVRLRRPESGPARLRMLVDTMLDLAIRLEAARAMLPAPAGIAGMVPAWALFAERQKLQFDPTYPSVEAIMGGRRIRAVARRSGKGWATDLRLWFRPHEPTGLRIFEQRAPDGYWSVGQDIQLGDHEFDHAFVVKAWDPLWVSEILRDDAQRELLALKQGADLEVDDHGIQLKDLPLDPDGMTARFDRMAAIAESLGW